MSENITGGILSAENESMTFSPFGVKVIPELKEESFSQYYA